MTEACCPLIVMILMRAKMAAFVMMSVLIYLHAVSGQTSYYDAGVSACRSGKDHFPFCNTSLSTEARVKDLLTRIPDHAKPNLLTARSLGI